METEWERSVERIALTCEQILERYGFAATRAGLIAEGRANTNYKLLMADGKQAVLRIYQRDPSTASLERAALRLVADRVPVPRALQAGDGFCLLEWLPGATWERLAAAGSLAEVDEAAFDIGSALASISAIRLPSAGFLAADAYDELTVSHAWESAFDGLFSHFRELAGRTIVKARAGNALCEQALNVVDKEEASLRAALGPPCLVHGDFKPSNLLIHQGRLSGVLDWEFAHGGTFLLSMGQVFRHADCLGPAFENRFRRGFEEAGGVLPDRWRHLARLVDFVSLFDFLAREPAGERMLADVTRLIAHTLGSA